MVAPQPVPPVRVQHHRSDPPPRLIVADATVELIERWKAELVVLRRRSPTSDAVGTLADCIRELVDAVNAGNSLTVQLTIGDARTISRMPVSTLRWLCKHKADLIGARKRGGIWYIDRGHFERYLSTTASSAGALVPDDQSERPAAISETQTHLAGDARADLRLEPR